MPGSASSRCPDRPSGARAARGPVLSTRPAAPDRPAMPLLWRHRARVRRHPAPIRAPPTAHGPHTPGPDHAAGSLSRLSADPGQTSHTPASRCLQERLGDIPVGGRSLLSVSRRCPARAHAAALPALHVAAPPAGDAHRRLQQSVWPMAFSRGPLSPSRVAVKAPSHPSGGLSAAPGWPSVFRRWPLGPAAPGGEGDRRRAGAACGADRGQAVGARRKVTVTAAVSRTLPDSTSSSLGPAAAAWAIFPRPLASMLPGGKRPSPCS